jgi:flagellar protein FlaI
MVDEKKQRALIYYVERDTVGFDKLHAIMLDPNVEDISCDGVGIGVYVYHRDPRFASVQTNVSFDSVDELNTFVSKLAQKSNKTISIAEPLLDASLPDGSRIQATLGTDIARRGSNFTIRKFTEKPLTPTHILRYKTMDSTQLAYLWLAVEGGQTILISGGTATGKTALLNALSLFIRPELKVVSIEDTAELRLPLPHWIPHVARAPLSIKGKIGEVTLFDLLKSSLRQRPDYLVLGEVRGKEAFVLFQQVATGHPALATMHAATIPQLIDRLVTPPISLPPGLLENIDIIVFLTLSRLKGSYVRRAENITEVTGLEDNKPATNSVFEWRAASDTFDIVGKSVSLREIAKKAGVPEESVSAELFRRKAVLDWMLERGIFDYKDVGRIISMYYSNPERITDLMASA